MSGWLSKFQLGLLSHSTLWNLTEFILFNSQLRQDKLIARELEDEILGKYDKLSSIYLMPIVTLNIADEA